MQHDVIAFRGDTQDLVVRFREVRTDPGEIFPQALVTVFDQRIVLPVRGADIADGGIGIAVVQRRLVKCRHGRLVVFDGHDWPQAGR
jgi:hypothetical protein